MIKAIGGHTVLENPVLTFTTSKDQLSVVEKELLSEINLFNYKFGKNVYSFEQRLFMKMLLEIFINEYNLFFYYLEKTAEPKTRLRSHKKLMYGHRKSIGEENIYEEEVQLNSNQTIIYSILHLTKDNIDYINENLIDSRFLFGYIANNDAPKNSIFDNLEIKKIIQSNPIKKGVFDMNILKVVSSKVNNSASILRLFRDGLNNDYVSLFYKNLDHLEEMKEMMNKFKIKNLTK